MRQLAIIRYTRTDFHPAKKVNHVRIRWRSPYCSTWKEVGVGRLEGHCYRNQCLATELRLATRMGGLANAVGRWRTRHGDKLGVVLDAFTLAETMRQALHCDGRDRMGHLVSSGIYLLRIWISSDAPQQKRAEYRVGGVMAGDISAPKGGVSPRVAPRRARGENRRGIWFCARNRRAMRQMHRRRT